MKIKSRLLIVDDNEKLSDSLRDILEDDGFAIETANNGKDAINLLRSNRYDIALVDIKLPDCSGTELVNNLVKISLSMEFILITANADLDTAIEAAKQEHIVSYELKPLDMNRLISLLNQVVKRRKVESEIQKLTHAVEQSSSTIVITNTNGKIEYANPRFAELTGYTITEAIGKNPRVLKSGKTSPEVYEELWSTIKSGNEWKGEFCNKKKNGELYWESASISPVKNTEGVITNFIAVKDDITERKKMEDALLQSEKLKSIGTITAGISHEFNNLLAIISGNVQLLEEDYKDDKVLTNALCTIMKAADDGAEISSNMLKFTKTKPDTKEFISSDIISLIRQAIAFTIPRWKNEAQSRGVNYDMDQVGTTSVPRIMCNPTEIREIFVNMINNALDAMPEGGRLSYSTWRVYDTVFVSITDKGLGMSEDVKKNIFDPFFSTKGVDGTGLGMSVAYGIVTRHGGKIDVASEAGLGTTFTMQFPASNERASLIDASGPEQITSEKDLRILVVDDEEDIRNILNQFLSRCGHKVKAVDNGADAINMVVDEGFDLVLCDLAMPNVCGYDVVKFLNGLKKRPKIGIVSGWDEKLDSKNNKELNVDFYLKKPFKYSELAKYIDEAFGEDSK
ncbi:MAG: response regulator [Candidatus Scalindua sp.]|nr:response regulator [Candidatus Scalindua sp.]